jgi:glycerol-3-phosphate O-acyltransferase
VFQNKERLRSGKFSHQRSPDSAIRWILDAYMHIKEKNIILVPVHIAYDRLLE